MKLQRAKHQLGPKLNRNIKQDIRNSIIEDRTEEMKVATSLHFLLFAQLSFPSSAFLKTLAAVNSIESMIPATVNVPPTMAQTVVRKL